MAWGTLQYPENLPAMNGKLQDSALKECIACFRRTAGKSFVLFSSRQPLIELNKWHSENHLSLDLKTLPYHEGAKLLQALGLFDRPMNREVKNGIKFERLERDTHPIIRAFFGEKIKDNYPEAFKQAHLVLFDYFQKLPEKEFPDTLDEMQPLYRAVVHGCLAGEYYKALISDVYTLSGQVFGFFGKQLEVHGH